MVRVRLDQPPIRESWRVAPRCRGSGGEASRQPRSPTGDRPGRWRPGGPANGLVSVVVDPLNGTFSIDGRPGFGRLVDGGDLGDSYNYSPPAVDSLVDRPDSVTVAVGEPGRSGLRR